jgi:hypothetical protein
MTRYQAATSTLSTWLAKARAPDGDDVTHNFGERAPISSPTRGAMNSATRHTRRLTLLQSWHRPEAPSDHRSLLVRLWRAMGG